jgi:hypothetical protein
MALPTQCEAWPFSALSSASSAMSIFFHPELAKKVAGRREATGSAATHVATAAQSRRKRLRRQRQCDERLVDGLEWRHDRGYHRFRRQLNAGQLPHCLGLRQHGRDHRSGGGQRRQRPSRPGAQRQSCASGQLHCHKLRRGQRRLRQRVHRGARNGQPAAAVDAPAQGDEDVAHWPCAPKARTISGGRCHPGSCRLIW